MHETDRLIQTIRGQQKTLQALLHYLESQGCWSGEDLGYCRSTLRRVARDLLTISRGPLGAVEVVDMTTIR